jgi:hypothetical protein
MWDKKLRADTVAPGRLGAITSRTSPQAAPTAHVALCERTCAGTGCE